MNLEEGAQGEDPEDDADSGGHANPTHSVTKMWFGHTTIYTLGRGTRRKDLNFANEIEESIGVYDPLDQLRNIELKSAIGSQLRFKNDVSDSLLVSCCASCSCQLVNRKGFCFIL